MHSVFMKKDSDKVDMLSQPEYSSLSEKEQPAPPVTFQKSASTPVWVWVLLGLASMLFLAGLITLIIAVTTGSKPCAPKVDDGDSSCNYSVEAGRANLQNFLKKVQSEYYALNSHEVTWQPGIERMDDHVRERYVNLGKSY